jgi:TolB-like protein/Tfp pilus assembly protein PilF
MPDNPNRLSQFWQELKRRKVVRVITVYAAAAFVILELTDIVAPSLGLPDWTMNFIIVLLSVGFIITVIVSWVYDITPEGIEKTEQADKVKTGEILSSSNSWKIASYISFVVIVGLIVLNIVPRTNNKKILEKSIAVLPLEYLSEDPNKQYLANGVLDAITGHLSMIEGLKVIPRTSVEQYRENKKSAKEIGEELDVSYLIEGSFLMVEDQVKLTIQLVVANEEDHVFFREYDRNYKDIFIVQSEVAQTIANEIEVAITSEEKQLIEKIPTINLTAYDFYQRGREEYIQYWLDNDDRASLDRAEELYLIALENDPEFALAYVGLARVYWHKNVWEEYFQINFIDSVLILTNIALSFDDKAAEAYVIRGNYYRSKGDRQIALQEYDKAIEINPNDWQAYVGLGSLFENDDAVKSLKNLHKAALLNHGVEKPGILRRIGSCYHWAGFIELGRHYINEALRLDGDSINYLQALGFLEMTYGNSEEALQLYKKALAKDSTRFGIYADIGQCYHELGDDEESLSYFKKFMDEIFARGQFRHNAMHRVGYAYWMNGFKAEAEQYFEMQLEHCNNLINSGRPYAQLYMTYYDRAGVYAFRGESEKAYADLKMYNLRQRHGYWFVQLINNDPLFDSIRDEPEFQQIVRDIEAKYQAEHERVRQWLEENDML